MNEDPKTSPHPESASPVNPGLPAGGTPSAPLPPPSDSSVRDPAPATASETGGRKLPLKTIGIAAIALIGVLVIARLIPSFGSSPEDTRRRLELKELHAAEAVQKEAEGLALAKLQDFAKRGGNADAAVTEFETELTRWEREVLPLLTSDDGRVLAAHEDFALAFDALLQRSRPTRQDASALRAGVSALTEPINAHLRNSDAAYTPSDAVKDQLERQRTDALADAATYRDAREQVDRMRTDAAKAGTALSAQTLRQTIDAIRARTAAAEAAKTAGEQRQAEVARAERSEAERAQLRVEAEAFATATDNKDLLAPFFASGTSRFTRHGPDGNLGCRAAGCTRFETPGPASYADLKTAGVFEDPKSFLRAIHALKPKGGPFTYFCRDDRPVFHTVIRPEEEDELLANVMGLETFKSTPKPRRTAFKAFLESAMDDLDVYICDDDKVAFRHAVEQRWSDYIEATANGLEDKMAFKRNATQAVDSMEKILLATLPLQRTATSERLKKAKLYGEFWVESGRLRP